VNIVETAAGLGLCVPSPVEEVEDRRISSAGLRLLLKRDDLIHPDMPGNKWRKLKYNLDAAKAGGYGVLLTFGGAYSNHLRATAAAGSLFGFETIGVVRGEEHLPLNPSLRFAVEHGMRLTYLDRSTYREKTQPSVIRTLRDRFGEFYLLPEGGSNALALKGCAELPAEIDQDFGVICCSCGTGGTLAGIAAGLGTEQRATGFSALKGGQFLDDDVRSLQAAALGHDTGNWRIETEFHFRGFAKRTPELDEFIEDFESRHGIRLEWVYEAKMMFGIFALARRGEFKSGTTVVAVINA
jgi:1-aminocyclopropane-1-carboxylate deaminase